MKVIITGGGTRVQEGPLNEASVAQMDSLLPAVREIDPAMIHNKQQITELDMVVVNVLTQRGVKNLQFADSDTRKPFRPAMDPLLKWLGGVPKSHLANVPDTKKNNCMPEGPDSEPTAKPPAMNARSAQLVAQHLLLRANIFSTDEGVATSRCFAVAPDGQYRYETQITSNAGMRSVDKVFAGTVEENELEELRKILDSERLRSSTHNPDPPNGVRAQSSEVEDFLIPREDHLQQLRFFSSSGLGSYATGEGKIITATDTDKKVEAPVRSWLKDRIERRKGASPLPNATPNRCMQF